MNSDMPLAIGDVGEFFVAIWTIIWFLASMCSHVSLDVPQERKWLIADLLKKTFRINQEKNSLASKNKTHLCPFTMSIQTDNTVTVGCM